MLNAFRQISANKAFDVTKSSESTQNSGRFAKSICLDFDEVFVQIQKL